MDNARKELNYVVKSDYELTADAVKSFYELKQFKKLLDKLTQEIKDEDKEEVKKIMKKILREDHQEEKCLENFKKILGKAKNGFLMIINHVDEIIPDSNEASRLTDDLYQLNDDLSEIEHLLQEVESLEMLIEKAGDNFNKIYSSVEEVDLIMNENKELIDQLEDIDLELEEMTKEY